jgi:hypothetical protein
VISAGIIRQKCMELRRTMMQDEKELLDEVRAGLAGGLSLDALRREYANVSGREHSGTVKSKLLAELSYLIAVRELRALNVERACLAAEEAVQLYKGLAVQTLEQAAPLLYEYLPDKMHEGVVQKSVLDKIPADARSRQG